ncbi:hypothetical protein K474DRAFT_1579855, partial [Panus rudis PR-1116 ss-1]
MDDDLTFGTAVWGANDPTIPSPVTTLQPPTFPPPPALTPQDSLNNDDFDDFGTPAETVAGDDDDEFGDFGEFGETVEAGPSGSALSLNESAFQAEPQLVFAGLSRDWTPLQIDLIPMREQIEEKVQELLGAILPKVDPNPYYDPPIRQVGGRNQVLITPESRRMFEYLVPEQPPEIKPVNWTRSKWRRQHLIALGIPVNLDEVLPPAGGKLPPLKITTRPSSAPPGPSSAPVHRSHAATANNSRAGTPRSGTPVPGAKSSSLANAQVRFGPPPELDQARINNLLALRSDDLLLLPVRTLESHLQAIREQTVQTSTLLTYLLQTRDALQQDSETYNKLIGEMVGEAQKMKTGK